MTCVRSVGFSWGLCSWLPQLVTLLTASSSKKVSLTVASRLPFKHFHVHDYLALALLQLPKFLSIAPTSQFISFFHWLEFERQRNLLRYLLAVTLIWEMPAGPRRRLSFPSPPPASSDWSPIPISLHALIIRLLYPNNQRKMLPVQRNS